MDLISIIVPIYNAEKYIDDCIKSILNQTYSRFELILIDDGSSDRSLEICNNWKRKDERIHVYSQKNGGASAARNFGLKVMQGDYVVFVDSDDWVSPKYIEFLYSPVEFKESQQFGIVGTLSTIISHQYCHLTAPQGKVERFSPNVAPNKFGFIIPDGYTSDTLPLWRFFIKPKGN